LNSKGHDGFPVAENEETADGVIGKLFENGKRCIEIGILSDFRNLFDIPHNALGVGDNDCPREQASQRPGGYLRTEILAETRRAKGRERDDIAQTFRLAKTTMGEGKIGRNTENNGIIEGRSLTVEPPGGGGANGSVYAWENIEDQRLTGIVVLGGVCQVGLCQGESGDFTSHLR